ncbi:MAG: DEAD/DEAH box helicase [Candidatus Thermoplasmatota archaeon]
MQVAHPQLKPGAVEFRGFQANLARIAGNKDTLVVLPTGMGKTVVALLVLADALQAGAQHILVLAPTKPLVDQHAAFLRSVFAEPWSGRIHALTGDQAPSRRTAAYAEPGIVVATPQVIQNDMVGARIDAAKLDWVVFDEAHRGVGDYAYTFIGQELLKHNPTGRRLGLTASPGHDARKVEEVRKWLGLSHVEIRTATDPDVAPYVQEVAMEWETLPLPPSMARVSAKLNEALADRVRALKATGLLKSAASKPTRRELLELAGQLQAKLAATAQGDPSWYSALSLQAQAIKILHAIELAETQGSSAVAEYIGTIRAEAGGAKPSKATRQVAEDVRVSEAFAIAQADDAENPKLGRTGTLVQQALERDADSRIIVFTHYRSTCERVAKHLATLPGVRPVLFVGQGKRAGQDGLTQKEQKATVEAFKAGTHNVLVATSVAEEGLDIPSTDLVVFYEPIPSEIRSIQRRGRTGRHREGRVVVLMTKGTQDEAAHWSSRRREQQMVRELQGLRETIATRPAGPQQATLRAAPVPNTVAPRPTGPRVIYDHREQSGAVVRHLHDLGATLEARQLEIADFILSDRVAVERKSAADFVDSLVDGRLFEQIRQLKEYPKPFLLIEGESLHGHRGVSPEAIQGALASILIDYGIPILQVRDGAETARFLHAVAKREQFTSDRKVAVRPGKPSTDADLRRFLVAGLPGVSEVLADRLLARFGSPANVFAASARELAEIDGIGEQKADAIRRILDAPSP